MPNTRGPWEPFLAAPGWHFEPVRCVSLRDGCAVSDVIVTVCALFFFFFFWLLCSQDLEFPRGRLILIIQAIGIEVQLPRRCLVLIIQAVCCGVEAQAGRPVALGGEGRRGLVQMACDRVCAHRTESWARAWQLMVHGGEVRAAVHAAEVGRRAGVALAIARGLRVCHGIGPLHAGGGGRQGVWERRDGRRAPDGHWGGAGWDGGDCGGAGGGRELAAGPALWAHFSGWGTFLFGRSHLVLAPVLLLLLLLATLRPPVLKPDLEESRISTRHCRNPLIIVGIKGKFCISSVAQTVKY